MNYITRPMAAAILNSLGPSFDAHMIEQRVLRLYPIAFAEELLRFRATADPLRQFSAAFAQWVDQTFAGQISKTQKVPSANLGGQTSDNQEWTKTATTPIT